MTGLDKIVHQILEEAEDTAKKHMQEAQEEAQNILTEAEEKAKEMRKNLLEDSEKEVANYREKRMSAIDLQRRTAILQVKQEIIEDILLKSYDRFCNMSDAQYFANLEKMLAQFVLDKTGEIYFSAKDLVRMPAEFAGTINDIAKAKGGRLEIAKETREIDGGFVLVYGGIEENCSFKALFDVKRSQLQDEVYKILFL